MTGWFPCYNQSTEWLQRSFSIRRNIRTPNRERKSVWVQQNRHLSARNLVHENHALHVNLHSGVWKFWKRIFFSVEAGRKSRASKTCKRLSLALACPCTLIIYKNRVCVCVCVCVCIFLIPLSTSSWRIFGGGAPYFRPVKYTYCFCPPVVRRCAVRHCTVYLSLSPGCSTWCCETLYCVPLSGLQS